MTLIVFHSQRVPGTALGAEREVDMDLLRWRVKRFSPGHRACPDQLHLFHAGDGLQVEAEGK